MSFFSHCSSFLRVDPTSAHIYVDVENGDGTAMSDNATCQQQQQVTWTLLANSLKVVGNVFTPPKSHTLHPPPLLTEASMCNIHVNNGNKWNAQKGARSSYMEKQQPASRRWLQEQHWWSPRLKAPKALRKAAGLFFPQRTSHVL